MFLMFASSVCHISFVARDIETTEKSTIECEWIDYSVSVKRWNQGLLRNKCCKILGWLHIIFFQWCFVKVFIYSTDFAKQNNPRLQNVSMHAETTLNYFLKKTTYKLYEQTIQAYWGAFVYEARFFLFGLRISRVLYWFFVPKQCNSMVKTVRYKMMKLHTEHEEV